MSAAPVAKAENAEAHVVGNWRLPCRRERVNAPAATHVEVLAAKPIRPRNFRMTDQAHAAKRWAFHGPSR